MGRNDLRRILDRPRFQERGRVEEAERRDGDDDRAGRQMFLSSCLIPVELSLAGHDNPVTSPGRRTMGL